MVEDSALKMDSDQTNFNPVIVDDQLLQQLRHSSALLKELDEIHDWNQRERDQWVEQKAKTLAPGSKIIDIGAGTCPYKKHFPHCLYHTHDFKRYEGSDYLKRDHNLPADGYGTIDFVSDISSLPVKSASYDAVLCTEVFEHIPEPILALQEFDRILKPGGRLFLTAPLASGLHQLPFHFYGGFTPEWYRRFCLEMGLEITSITPLGGFFKHLSQECARFSWTIDQHRHLHGDRSDSLSYLFSDLLARYFYSLDEQCPIDKFTVGYMLEARRIDSCAALQKHIDLDPGNLRLFIAASRLALDLDNLPLATKYAEDLLEIDSGSKIGQQLYNDLQLRKKAKI